MGIEPGLPHLFIGLGIFLALALVLRKRRQVLRTAFLGVVALQLLNEIMDILASDAVRWSSLGKAVLVTALTITRPGLIWWSAYRAKPMRLKG